MDNSDKPFLFRKILDKVKGIVYIVAMIYMTLSIISKYTRPPKPAQIHNDKPAAAAKNTVPAAVVQKEAERRERPTYD
jgi:hypothetical protein